MKRAWAVIQPYEDKLPLMYEVETLEFHHSIVDTYKGYTRVEIIKILWKPSIPNMYQFWNQGMRTYLSDEAIYGDKKAAIKIHKEKLLAVKKIVQRQFEESWDQLKAIAECDYSFMQDNETYISPFDGEIK